MKQKSDTLARVDYPVRGTVLKVLLACGILSSLIYVATDVMAAMRWEGYRYADRAVSELLAVGSPTRAFVVLPMIAYNVLIVAFGAGVWMSAGPKRSLRISGTLMVVYGIVSFLGFFVFPLRQDSALSPTGQMPLSGVLHSGATIVLVVLMFLFIGFGSSARGKGFRLYSIVTILTVLAGGVLAGTLVQRIAAGVPTPGFGLLERTNIYSSLLWVAVLAVVLLQANKERATAPVAETEGGVMAKKRVAVLLGSPHRGGATYTASRKFLDNLEAFGDVEGEIVTLSDYDISRCRGCKVCFARGEEYCPLKDDRDAIIAKMTAADAVVFASPNYSWHVSGVMKVFLDRLGFAFHRPQFHGKTSTAIVVQGIMRGGEIRKYLEFVAGGLGFTVVKGSVMRTLEPMTEKAVQRMDKTLAEQARRFHDQLLRPTHPTPSLFALMMFRMGRTGMKLGAAKDERDYAFYTERGWFESDFYYPTHLGLLKKAAGALFDWLGAHLRVFQVADETGAATQPPSSNAASQ